eukprot:76326-Pyramimonas_sp.AAC.1
MNKVIDDMTPEVTNSFAALLRRIRTAGLYKKAWQAFMKCETANAGKDCVSTISQELDSAATADIKKETAGTPSTTGVTATPSVAAKRHFCMLRPSTPPRPIILVFLAVLEDAGGWKKQMGEGVACRSAVRHISDTCV